MANDVVERFKEAAKELFLRRKIEAGKLASSAGVPPDGVRRYANIVLRNRQKFEAARVATRGAK